MFVGEVSGIDLARTLPPETVAELNGGDQSLRRARSFTASPSTTTDLLALGRTFGNIEPPRNHRVERRLKHAELADISNLTPRTSCARATTTAASTRWATSSGIRTLRSAGVPGALSMLFAHVVPPFGGETEFADLRAAYDAL